ncbi:MAG: LPS translocon maturation chaperone LptM [Burkholderiales bacterium]
MRRTILVFILAFFVASCGTKGALYIAPPDTDDSPKRRIS